MAEREKLWYNYLETPNPRQVCGTSQCNVQVKRVITNELQRNAWTAVKPVKVEYLGKLRKWSQFMESEDGERKGEQNRFKNTEMGIN